MAIVSALKKRNVVIKLHAVNSFATIQQELIAKLDQLDNSRGKSVVLDLGDREVTEGEIRILEDVLLDYDMELKEIRVTPIAKAANMKLSENNVFTEMSPYEQTDLICKNLRSGQKIFSKGNVVILGDVNPGAEVVAGGNILVMGNLRGMAHAGANGDENSIIAAYRLNPTQIRIANHITRPPDGEAILVNTPELARIRVGKVIIEKLKI